MQRVKVGERAGYAGRRLAARDRNVAGPRMPHFTFGLGSRPYGLRMRNMPPRDRGAWATLVKQMRAVTKMTGAELARRLDVDRATIWRWETGKQMPENVEVLTVFASLFGLDVEEVLATVGLRPATEEVAPTPELRFDPNVIELQRMLDDPATPPATREQVLALVKNLKALVAQQPPAPPVKRTRKKAG